MTTNTTRCLRLVLVLPLLLLAVGCDSGGGALMQVNVPEESPSGAFTIRFAQDAVSPTTSEGSFKAFGFIDDNGSATEAAVPEPA